MQQRPWYLAKLGGLAIASYKSVSLDHLCVVDDQGYWWRVDDTRLFVLQQPSTVLASK